MTHKHQPIWILKEHGEWLRYVLWACAAAMALLTADTFAASAHDPGKIFAGAMGVLLFGFSGCALKTRRIGIDPLNRSVLIVTRGYRRSAVERIGIDAIQRILVLTTFDTDENLRGAPVMRERWLIALALRERTVAVTRNLYVRKEQALRDAARLQRRLGTDIVDSVEDSIGYLAQQSRTVEAITLAMRALAMTTEQAKNFVGQYTGRAAR